MPPKIRNKFIIGVVVITFFAGMILYLDQNVLNQGSGQVLGITDYNQKKEDENMVKNVSALEAKNLISENRENSNFVILDVRTVAERETDGYLKDSVNIDYYQQDFNQKIENLDKSKNYLIYCRSGSRSIKTAEFMKDKNFLNLYNLSGGIVGWQSQNLEIER